jgi:AraC family transcriptional regulator, transcriptional activator of pobA
MKRQEIIPETLYELYRTLGLHLELLDPKDTFTIHNVRDLLPELPFTSPRFRPNYFNFLFVKHAYGRCMIDEVAYELEPGAIYFTNPGCYRTFGWRAIDDAWLITFNESYLKEHVHSDIFAAFPFLLTENLLPLRVGVAEFGDFERWCRLLLDEHHRDGPYRERVCASLFVVLLLKLKERFWIDYNPIYEGNRGSQIVKSFRRNLEQHFRDLLNGKVDKVFRANDFAALQSLHPSYLNNVIKSKTGKPIGVWIAEKTIAEAKGLLQDPSVPIKEIAFALGFAESTHFSAYFKKHVEVSPVEYRRRNDKMKKI